MAIRALVDSTLPLSASELLLLDVAPAVPFDESASPPVWVRVGDDRLDERDVDGLVQQALGARNLVESP